MLRDVHCTLDTVQDFFDLVGHQITYASMGKKHFFSQNNVIIRPTKIMIRADKNWAYF